MKKILLTNAFIKNYTGSELDTVEIANYFIDNNYLVDIFTLEKGYPILKELNKNVRVLTLKDVKKLYKKYDILWSHHHPLLDYLIFNTDIKFDYIHHICLSFYEAYEQLPLYYKDLNLVSAMSEKCKDELLKNISATNKENITIFPNYAKSTYFNKNKHNSNNINKVAIVSNHVVDELIDLKQLLENQNVKLDIYGVGYNYVKIDENVLLEYDVIISIGKTCYWSIALGIPTYVYDRFGGDGYITPKNIEKSFENNFSGRAFKKKMNAKEIYEDLFSKYQSTLVTLQECKEYGLKNFCFENQMESFLKRIYDTQKFNKTKLINKNPYFVKTGKLFVEQIGFCKDALEYLQNQGLNYCQLFYDTSKGYNEEESIRKNSICIEDNTYEVEFCLEKDCKSIRFDICETELVKIDNVYINGKKLLNVKTNNIVEIWNNKISLNNDPSFVIERNFKRGSVITFKYELTKKHFADFYENYLNEKNIILKELANERNKLSLITEEKTKIENENTILNYEINNIKNSKLYKLLVTMRKILKGNKPS